MLESISESGSSYANRRRLRPSFTRRSGQRGSQPRSPASQACRLVLGQRLPLARYSHRCRLSGGRADNRPGLQAAIELALPNQVRAGRLLAEPSGSIDQRHNHDRRKTGRGRGLT